MLSKTMRDVFLDSLYEKMKNDKTIFFITVDFGSPVLDRIRKTYPDRFINVGIAEQNLVNVATGLALEGFIVYAYGIAPFITMRCYEQIRINVSMLSQIKPININFISVGAGVSYALSGPTHHCLEDLSIMKTLPNIEIFSPSDYILARAYVERSLSLKKPKYIRLDAKPLPLISETINNIDDGFRVLQKGKRLAIISTGYMTHKILKIAKNFKVTIIDLYLINNYNKTKLEEVLKDINVIITLEEGFIKGGLDAEINFHFKNKETINLGFEKKYIFDIGDREFIHRKNMLSYNNIVNIIKRYCNG